MSHHSSSIVSPISEVPSQMKGRKSASTGGNRSWSEEEETYLLQTRLQKMPYKHIAAHLKKTELACRLHFHQLSHGSHRRKRTASISSHTSAGSVGTSPYINQHSHSESEEYAVESRQSSPMSYTSRGTPPQSIQASPASRPHIHHKVLLPKPSPLTPRHSHSPEPLGLRINTGDNSTRPGPVDTDRLRAIYESRRAHFWASIASEYGTDISPAQLEEIWRQGGALRPPTPEASPDSLKHHTLRPTPFSYAPAPIIEPKHGFTATNHSTRVLNTERPQYTLPIPQPSAPRLARTWSTNSAPAMSNVPIAALLTEDKEPRRD